jgi:hypothetical protein
MTTTPQAALLSEAAKLADELDHEASKRACNVAMMPASLPVDAAKELRRLDALVAHLTADRDDTANELALRTKHNLALTNERDQLLAKLQATQEPVQAGELPAFEQWWRQRQLLTFPKDYDQSRLADWGDAYKPAAKDAWQARAALSARKPLTMLAPEAVLKIWIARFDGASKDFAMKFASDLTAEFCRINGIDLEVKL